MSPGRLDKRIVDQASDVPSIIFFRLFIDLGHPKLFTFIFVFFLKKNKQIDWKYFCKEFCKKSWKKIMLGTSDAWLMIHFSHRPSDWAWIYLRLTNFKIWKTNSVLSYYCIDEDPSERRRRNVEAKTHNFSRPKMRGGCGSLLFSWDIVAVERFAFASRDLNPPLKFWIRFPRNVQILAN